MQGPLTAADEYDFEAEAEPQPQRASFAVNGSDGVVEEVPDYSTIYEQGAARLRGEREGLSARQRLGALLMGFSQPTRHGKWQEMAVNASTGLFQQTLEQRKRDEERRREIARLEERRAIAKLQYETSKGNNERTTAAKLAAAKNPDRLNAQEKDLLGEARRIFPDKSIEELLSTNALHDPRVRAAVKRAGIAAQAAAQGYDPQAALAAFDKAMIPPEASAPLAMPERAPPGMTPMQLRAQAQDAIARGGNKTAILNQLRKWAVPTEGL